MTIHAGGELGGLGISHGDKTIAFIADLFGEAKAFERRAVIHGRYTEHHLWPYWVGPANNTASTEPVVCV